MNAYPLKFRPIYKERIWGAQKLREVFGKDLPAGQKIGESWELADLPDDKSLISNGPWARKSIRQAVDQFTEAITGRSEFPRPFPLLVKLLDAQDVLSVQVHPDRETCQRMGQGDPKTECWYIIAAEPEACIYKGLKPGELLLRRTPKQFRLVFHAAVRGLCLTDLKLQPYGLRRGGATDLFLKTGNMDEVTNMGRWRDSRTARIYVTTAIAVKAGMALSEAQSRRLEVFARYSAFSV